MPVKNRGSSELNPGTGYGKTRARCHTSLFSEMKSDQPWWNSNSREPRERDFHCARCIRCYRLYIGGKKDVVLIFSFAPPPKGVARYMAGHWFLRGVPQSEARAWNCPGQWQWWSSCRCCFSSSNFPPALRVARVIGR